MAHRHRRVALICASIAVGMVGAAYAAVPLYQMFCQVTGFGGTTMVASAPSGSVTSQLVTIRFDANTRDGIPWSFTPVQTTTSVQLGENALAFYRATNTSDRPITGSATFNVTPELAGQYFNKIECFCFTEQTLQPGESIDMPVSFFIDPAIAADPDIGRVSQITLSYSFYPVANPTKGVAASKPAQTGAAETGKGG